MYFKGELKREDLEEEIIRRSLSLAKRQKTWFKKDKSIVWRDFKEDPLKFTGKSRTFNNSKNPLPLCLGLVSAYRQAGSGPCTLLEWRVLDGW